MKKKWIGIDGVANDFFAATARGERIGAGEIRSARSCGCFVEAALPAHCLFIEKLDLPAAAGGKGDGYLDNLLDVKLPIAVEDCQTVYLPCAGSSVFAFAIQSSGYERFLADFEKDAGCRPERVVPAPIVLWNRARRFAKGCDCAGGALIHLHLAKSGSVILIGDTSNGDVLNAELKGVVSLPRADEAFVMRNLKISAARTERKVSAIFLSGDADTDSFKGPLKEVFPEAMIKIVPDKEIFLAVALANDGERAGDSSFGNFATGKYEHPALTNRRTNKAVLAAATVLVALSVFACSAFAYKLKAYAACRMAGEEVALTANKLSGRVLKQAPLAAMRVAQNEFAGSINNDVEAFASDSPLSALNIIINIASVKDVKIASVKLNNNMLVAELFTSVPTDLSVFVRELEAVGYAAELQSDGDNKKSLLLKVTKEF